jgi:hypothetical protein
MGPTQCWNKKVPMFLTCHPVHAAARLKSDLAERSHWEEEKI